VKQAKLEEITSSRPRRSEASLRGALDTATGEDDKDAKPSDEPKDETEASDEAKPEAQDYQLSRALDLIRGLSIMNQNAAAK